VVTEQKKAVTELAILLTTEFDLTADQSYQLKQHLDCLYQVGFYEGRGQYSHRKQIEQIQDGKVIGTYKSLTHAAAVLGIDDSTIGKAIKENRRIRQGYRFRIVKIKK